VARRGSGGWFVEGGLMESDPSLVEQCLKNCLLRESKRGKVTIREVHSRGSGADGY
jgi:hypothetical protein